MPPDPPEFPPVPLDGVTELRIHGVAATPTERMLDDPHPVQVWGDPVAGFYRRPQDGNKGTDHLEAYSWGRLTGGAAARAAWLLLLPFMLVNVASWAHPARRATRSNTVGTMTGALRVLALGLTATYVLAMAVLSMDVLPWQCAGAPADCGGEHWYTRWLTEPGFWQRPGTRIAVGALLPVALVVAIWVLSKSSTKKYERWGDEQPPAAPDPAAPLGANDLSNPRFWQGRGPVTRLRAMHVAGSFALVAFLVAYAARSDERANARPLGALLAGLALALLAALAVTLFTPWAGRRRDLFENNPPPAAFCRAVMLTPWVALGLLAAALAYAVALADPPATAGALPGVHGVKHLLVAVQGASIAVLLIANVAAHRARDKADPESAHGPLLRGQTATFLAVLATAVAGGFAAGLTLRFADYLGCPGDCADAGEVAFRLPREYLLAARAFAAAAAVAAVSVLWFLLVTRRRVRKEAARTVAVEYAEFPDRKRRAQIARIHAGAAYSERGVWPLAATVLGGMAGALVLTRLAHHDWAASVANLGTWLVGAFAAGLVVLGRAAYRNPSLRRTVGILWDVGTFWPRAVHPFAPPCYCERTVPEFAERIAQLRAGNGRVVVSAHSQGSVVAFAALLQFRRDPAGLALVTYGSPLHRFYARAFPHFFGLPVLRYGRTVLGGRWTNLYRRSDPIGGPVTCADADVPAGATHPDRRLRDPAFAKPPHAFEVPSARGHSNYFHDPAFAETVGVLANGVRAG